MTSLCWPIYFYLVTKTMVYIFYAVLSKISLEMQEIKVGQLTHFYFAVALDKSKDIIKAAALQLLFICFDIFCKCQRLLEVGLFQPEH